MNTKNYILSQKFKYLGLGAIIALILSLNESPLDYYMIFGFGLIAFGISWWFEKRK